MMITLLALAALSGWKPPFDENRLVDLARQHCAAEWRDDFEMQAYCLKKQADGMGVYQSARASVGPALNGAVVHCLEEWTTAGVPDFEMIGYCVRKQADAYRQLHR
jgi:hypothetical protein